MTVQELFQAAQELNLADQLRLASQLMQAVVQAMQQPPKERTAQQADPLIGLFAGTPDLSTQAEERLSQGINSMSGFSWKA